MNKLIEENGLIQPITMIRHNFHSLSLSNFVGRKWFLPPKHLIIPRGNRNSLYSLGFNNSREKKVLDRNDLYGNNHSFDWKQEGGMIMMDVVH